MWKGSWKGRTCITSKNQHDVLTTGKFSGRSSLRKSTVILQYPWGIGSWPPADTKVHRCWSPSQSALHICRFHICVFNQPRIRYTEVEHIEACFLKTNCQLLPSSVYFKATILLLPPASVEKSLLLQVDQQHESRKSRQASCTHLEWSQYTLPCTKKVVYRILTVDDKDFRVFFFKISVRTIAAVKERNLIKDEGGIPGPRLSSLTFL